MTSPNTPVDVEALEAVARAATPGEWKAFPADPGGAWGVRAVYESAEGFRTTAFPATCQAGAQPNEANATFIATFAPPTVLRLLAERREMLEALKSFDQFAKAILHDEDRKDDNVIVGKVVRDPAGDWSGRITFGDLRRVRAILSALPEGKGE